MEKQQRMYYRANKLCKEIVEPPLNAVPLFVAKLGL